MTARRAAVLVLALAACRDRVPIDGADASLRVTADAGEVECGRAFGVTVVRTWREDLVPDEWSDRALAPLEARLLDVRRRDDGAHVEETRRFECRAFALEDVAISRPSFSARPRGGGAPIVATAGDVRVHVKPAVDRAAPGVPELPGEPLREPFPWALWTAVTAALVAALGFGARVLCRRAPNAQPLPSPRTSSPREKALARIERLRASDPTTPAEREAFHVEAADLVREYLEQRFAIRALEMTTEELRASPSVASGVAPAHRDLLAGFLGRFDLAKFGREPATAGERATLLDAAERFVRETP
jgi:hypothetical protein